MHWPIGRVAQASGTTSRALRHYEERGLLQAATVGANGYRYYDEAGLLRLQQILLMRDLGMGLAEIRAILDGDADPASALERHLDRLKREQRRVTDQIRSVQHTITRLKEGQPIMPEEMFEGFDHTQYRDEVRQRWGDAAVADGDEWFSGLGRAGQQQLAAEQEAISRGFGAAHTAGLAPDSAPAQDLARRQYEWLSGIPGTPQTDTGRPTPEYFVGLADMYVADDRFARTYDRHGEGTAQFVRAAMRTFADENL
jgi:DNA-binding transcriptional MerR regulator